MLFADILDSFFNFLCWGFILIAAMIGCFVYCIGSAVESISKSETARDATKFAFRLGVGMYLDDDDDDDD